MLGNVSVNFICLLFILLRVRGPCVGVGTDSCSMVSLVLLSDWLGEGVSFIIPGEGTGVLPKPSSVTSHGSVTSFVEV